MSRRGPIVAALITACMASGCVYADKPLSDAKTSVIDEKLIGTWQAVEPGGDGEEDAPRGGAILVIGRKKGADRTMEWVTAGLDQDRHVRVERVDLLVRPGTPPLLSIGGPDRKGRPRYLIATYEIDDRNRLLLRLLKRGVVEQAIDKGELRGEVVAAAVPDDPDDPKPDADFVALDEHDYVLLTGPSEEIVQWINSRKDCFMEDASTFRRLGDQRP